MATTTCSGHHSDSKPAASAVSAMWTARSGSGKAVLANTIPHFMVTRPLRPVAKRLDGALDVLGRERLLLGGAGERRHQQGGLLDVQVDGPLGLLDGLLGLLRQPVRQGDRLVEQLTGGYREVGQPNLDALL